MTRHGQAALLQHWIARKPWVAVATATLVFAVSMASFAAGNHGKNAAAKPADEAGKTADGETPPAKADIVRITIQTVPPRKAQVKWGRKSLGLIPAPRPLVVERPRDSGPLDLAIRASGFLPVHTRAYTFTDSRVAVKLTPPSDKNKLFGYREEPTPNPDAGAPGAPAPAAPAPAALPEPPKP